MQRRSTLQSTSAGSRLRRPEVPTTGFSENGFQEQERRLPSSLRAPRKRHLSSKDCFVENYVSERSKLLHAPRGSRIGVHLLHCCSLNCVNCARHPDSITSLVTEPVNTPATSKILRRGVSYPSYFGENRLGHSSGAGGLPSVLLPAYTMLLV